MTIAAASDGFRDVSGLVAGFHGDIVGAGPEINDGGKAPVALAIGFQVFILAKGPGLVRQFCRERCGAILHPGSIQGKRPLDAACHGGNGGCRGRNRINDEFFRRGGADGRVYAIGDLGSHVIGAIGQGGGRL